MPIHNPSRDTSLCDNAIQPSDMSKSIFSQNHEQPTKNEISCSSLADTVVADELLSLSEESPSFRKVSLWMDRYFSGIENGRQICVYA